MSRSSSKDTERFLAVSEEVRDALRDGGPVVALESTIITHGMPFPDNLSTALGVQTLVRGEGAVPATIAIVSGKLRVGLGEDELERLASATGSVRKASRRDIPVLLQQRASAGTTVAATMLIARLAGLRIFATGGIGGVHRGAEHTMDVSADLQELARTSVAVVCAGAKSILDLGRTLEYLETHGVPVLGYRTRTFPAFYCRDSGHALEDSFDTPEALADVLHAKWALGLVGGVVIANPIPQAAALSEAQVDEWIREATQEAASQGIRGKDITPFLLARIVELSGGESLKANVALIRHNAVLAARTASAYTRLAAPPPGSDH